MFKMWAECEGRCLGVSRAHSIMQAFRFRMGGRREEGEEGGAEGREREEGGERERGRVCRKEGEKGKTLTPNTESGCSLLNFSSVSQISSYYSRALPSLPPSLLLLVLLPRRM